MTKVAHSVYDSSSREFLPGATATHLAHGAAKDIYLIKFDDKAKATPGTAYCTPRGCFRESELRDEVDTAKKINDAIQAKKLDPTYLAVDLKVSKFSIDRKFTAETTLASGDLQTLMSHLEPRRKLSLTDRIIKLIQSILGTYNEPAREEKKNKLTLDQRFEIALQAIKAVEALHKAGFVHGDLKPDNFLFFKDKHGKITIKLSDWGKTKKTR